MQSFIQLNLHTDGKKPETANTANPEHPEHSPHDVEKKLNRIARKAAHKAAAECSKGTSGIFSK
jgi:hypothetical protein